MYGNLSHKLNSINILFSTSYVKSELEVWYLIMRPNHNKDTVIVLGYKHINN